MENTIIEVRSLKYDGRLHRQWQAELINYSPPLLTVKGVFEVEINHTLLGTISPGTVSTEYYWTDRWYSVFRFAAPSGELRNFYCNVNSPPELVDEILTFVDLDIDILVAPDLSYKIVDQEEFAAHEIAFNYPPSIRHQVDTALTELRNLIELRAFPFTVDPISS